MTKYETKWCVPGSVGRTTFLLIGESTLSNIAYQNWLQIHITGVTKQI